MKAESQLYFPGGYSEREGGLYGPDKEGNLTRYTFTPLRVHALVRSADSKGWAYDAEIVDFDGMSHRLTIAARELACGGGNVLRQLVDHGLAIVPGMERAVLAFFQECQPPSRKVLVTTSGWLDDRYVFVLPGRVIGDLSEGEVVYAPQEDSATQKAIHSLGTLDSWSRAVAAKTKGNPILLFSILLALTGPLLKLLRLDGGGFHLFGPSSRGKTTALQVASSVWGDGSDPGSPGKKPLTCRWNMTANAVEGVAAVHNDLVTALDELGTFTGADFGALVYNLTSGQGKATLNSARKLQTVRTYRGNILSCGEVSSQAKIQSSGKRAMAGQLLRLVDIPVGDDILRETHGLTASEFAVALKKASATCYGTAGPAFVEHLVEALADDREYALGALHEGFEAYAKELTPSDAHPEQGRVMRRLAAVNMAGVLALEFGVLPLEREDVDGAVLFVRDLWLKAQHSIADADRALKHLKSFLIRNHTTFANVLDDNAKVSNCKGFWNANRDCYLFTDDQLEAAANGYDPKNLARLLRDKSLLGTEEGGRLKVGQKIAAMKHKKVRLYAVRAAIIEDNAGDEEAPASVPASTEVEDQFEA